MPILLFLLDTSASMNQRTYLGTTYLDIAKGAVEVFMKVKNNLTPTSLQASVQRFYFLQNLVGEGGRVREREGGILGDIGWELIFLLVFFFVSFFDSCVPETRLVEATGTC